MLYQGVEPHGCGTSTTRICGLGLFSPAYMYMYLPPFSSHLPPHYFLPCSIYSFLTFCSHSISGAVSSVCWWSLVLHGTQRVNNSGANSNSHLVGRLCSVVECGLKPGGGEQEGGRDRGGGRRKRMELEGKSMAISCQKITHSVSQIHYPSQIF